MPIRSRSPWWWSASPISRCVIGELVPKRIAFNNPERVAASVAPFMARLSVAGAPIVFLLRVSTDALVKLLRIPDKPESQVSEEEVKRLIAEGARTGIFQSPSAT